MTPQYGYVNLPTTTYNDWKNAVNGEAFDFDYSFGCQCYDLVVEFWWNVGFPQGYPTSGGTGKAYAIWDDRVNNSINNGQTVFTLVYNKEDIKRGDIIVYNHFAGNEYGHIGFADEDYNGSNNLPILSQNNGGIPTVGGGSATNVNTYDLQYFRGAFRYKEWNSTPPTPPVITTSKSHFKWTLYARKLRDKRNGL